MVRYLRRRSIDAISRKVSEIRCHDAAACNQLPLAVLDGDLDCRRVLVGSLGETAGPPRRTSLSRCHAHGRRSALRSYHPRRSWPRAALVVERRYELDVVRRSRGRLSVLLVGTPLSRPPLVRLGVEKRGTP